MSDKSFCTVFLIKYRFWGLKRLDFNNFITVSNKRSIVHHEIKKPKDYLFNACLMPRTVLGYLFLHCRKK